MFSVGRQPTPIGIIDPTRFCINEIWLFTSFGGPKSNGYCHILTGPIPNYETLNTVDRDMPLIITTSFTQFHCDVGFKILRSCGIKDPVASKGESLDPHELGARLSAVHLKRRKDQYSPVEPARIGKAWQLAAGKIVIANAGQDHWGWADCNIISLLDFWVEFEPDARFALFYTEPGMAAAAALSEFQRRSTSPDEIESELNSICSRWAQFNSAMMRFYSKHEDQCILVNLAAARTNTTQLRKRLALKLEIDVTELTIDEDFLPSPPTSFGLLNTTNSGYLDSNGSDILEQMETHADCRGFHGDNRPINPTAILAEHLDMDQKATHAKNELLELQSDFALLRDKLYAQRASIDRDLKKKSAENELLVRQLKQVQEELLERQLQLETERDRAPRVESVLEDIKSENELLLMQLEQVQEELELQFKNTQQVVNTSSIHTNTARGSLNVATHNSGLPTKSVGDKTAETKTHIDLRHFINGMNWHEPEHDGRWAGPGTRSSIRLPHLAKGRYKLTIEIIDAMNRDIFDGMSVTLGSKKLRTKRSLRTNVFGALAGLKRVRAHVNKDISPFPAAVEAKFVVDGDLKKYAELFLDFPEAHSPSERGEPDMRRMTARISYIDIVPA